MSTTHLWAATILLFLLLLTPPAAFLFTGWKRRKSNIVESFSDAAIQLYFRAFHPHVHDEMTDSRARFDKYYQLEFGRSRFVWPLILLAAIAGLLFCWSTLTISDLLQNESIGSGKLPVLAIVAFLGAYMWVVSDEIGRWYSADLSPADMYWWCFRFAVAIPMGYAIKGVLTENLAIPTAFLLGAFPTTQLMTIARRIVIQNLKFNESEGNALSQLQKLQCIDFRKAEQFVAEGVTTILQLAYTDPIRLTIRTGLNYSYMVDCACQSLLWIYVEDKIEMLRLSGLRSAYEVLALWLDLHEPDRKDAAEQVVREAAAAAGIPESSFMNILSEVALDPNTQFLFLSWSGYRKEDLSPNAQRVFDLDSEFVTAETDQASAS